MPTYHVRAEMRGTPTEDQQLLLADDGATLVHFNSATGLGEVRIAIEETNLAAAIACASGTVANLDNLRALTADGVLTEPHRIVVEAVDAPQAAPTLVGTGGIAALLGISDARVRQLRDDDPGFPRPIPVPGVKGDVYLAGDVEAYRATRQPGQQTGRPRATDDPRLRAAIRAALDLGNCSPIQWHTFQRALRTEDGRAVRAMAIALRRLDTYQREQIAAALDGDARDLFLSTLTRADEIMGG